MPLGVNAILKSVLRIVFASYVAEAQSLIIGYFVIVLSIFSCCLVAKILEISDERRQNILSSQDFSQFFDKATRLVEKAICENMDICFDYGETGEDAEG